MPQRRLHRLALALAVPALLLPTAACYQSVPIAGAQPLPRQRIAGDLTVRASLDLAPRIGNLVQRVEGSVVEASDSTLVVALTAAVDRRGITTTWTGEAVEFRRDQIATIRERRLSHKRSWLLTAGIVALAAAAGGFSGAFGGEERGSEGSQQ